MTGLKSRPLLKRDLSRFQLDATYSRDYYWYLGSPEFHRAFLLPLADCINTLGLPVLDVGCGKGWLATLVEVPYTGFDGSLEAVIAAKQRAKTRSHRSCFAVARVEDVPYLGKCPTLVFGNVLWYLANLEYYGWLLSQYCRVYQPAWVIVYDLQRLDEERVLDCPRLKLVKRYAASAHLRGVEEVKRHRKILVYQCN